MFKSIFLSHLSFLTFYNKAKGDIVASTICILPLSGTSGLINGYMGIKGMRGVLL